MNHFKFLSNVSNSCVTRVQAFACVALLSACTYSTGSFNEPGLRGKLIDAETSQPVQGAVVYGYYATAAGSLGGGETIKEILRVFEVESNAEGVFEVPAWKTSWSITSGEPRQRFPAIAIYKDGYKLDLQNLATIAHWVSHTKLPGEATRTGNVIDWTAVPAQLKPATERERYNALYNSNYAYADIGDCGWEQHVKLIDAQHSAHMRWITRNIPPESIRGDGYPMANYRHPDDMWIGLGNHSVRDRLIEGERKLTTRWRCKSPATVFPRTK